MREPHPRKHGIDGRRCRHVWYRMSCEHFDELLARAAGGCEICRDNSQPLFIDHEPRVGRWAVRGLLCCSCNTRLADGATRNPRQAIYEARSWYLGVQINEPAEPPVGTRVDGPFGAQWRRTAAGWLRTTYAYQAGITTWHQICRGYGAHNLVTRVAGEAFELLGHAGSTTP